MGWVDKPGLLEPPGVEAFTLKTTVTVKLRQILKKITVGERELTTLFTFDQYSLEGKHEQHISRAGFMRVLSALSHKVSCSEGPCP